jgi:hypothetical protein
MLKPTEVLDGMGYTGIPNPNFIGRCGSCHQVITSLDQFCRQCGCGVDWGIDGALKKGKT